MNSIERSWAAQMPLGGGARELAMLAHDIRSALNGVIGGLGQIDEAVLEPAVRAQVERVTAAALTLHSLVGTVIGEEPAAKPDGSSGVVEIRRMMRHLHRRWTGEAEEKGLRFELITAEDVPEFLMVPLVPLVRVLGNLISNAIKYSDRGAVRFEARADGDGGLEMLLHDDGPGLSVEVREGLYGYGVRDNDSVQPGNGLGLHIAKQLTDQIGGEIHLDNRNTGGVEAVLRFPPRLCGDGDRLRAQPAEAAARTSLQGLTVLLAEDNPTNQMVAGQMLRSLGARVVIASDGIETLELFEKMACDVVLVDIEMPRMSGLEVIRTIRERGDGRADVPLIALTAFALREHRVRIADAGANGLISKPINSVAAFGRTIREHVGARGRGGRNGAALPGASEAAAASPGTEAPVVDRSIYQSLIAAIGTEMMSELLEKVDSDIAESEAKLRDARTPLDVSALRSASHIIISVAGAIGATRLQESARRLNTAAHDGASSAIDGELSVCFAEIAAARDFVGAQRTGAGA